MKKLSIIAGAVLALTGATAAGAQAFGQGQWVLARSAVGGSHFYPGVVAGMSGNQVTINFDDGTTETRPASQVRPYDWRNGSFVSCVWRPDGKVYGAVIQKISGGGTQLTIRYVDDGIVATVRTGECYSD
ncbi:hypothetical protein [Parasphingorhabdus sp.]|uniref:hypothetical protein n=1 Tax=Parasphingorhabdus sp. TaxID=2709688 RepID=UPI00359366F7